VTPSLRAFALSLVGDRDRADDLVQDTLLRALQKQDRFEPDTKLQAWLFTILRNLFYSDYRRRKREVEDVDGLYAAKLSTLPEQPGCAEFETLRSALARLSDEQREAVLLVGAQGYSYEQVAEICGAPLGTIKSRVNRARKRLAELLKHEHDRARQRCWPGWGDAGSFGAEDGRRARLGCNEQASRADLIASLGAPLWVGRLARPCVRREEALPHSSGGRAPKNRNAIRRARDLPARNRPSYGRVLITC